MNDNTLFSMGSFFMEQRQTYVSEIIYPQVIKTIITIRENQPMFIFPEH